MNDDEYKESILNYKNNLVLVIDRLKTNITEMFDRYSAEDLCNPDSHCFKDNGKVSFKELVQGFENITLGVHSCIAILVKIDINGRECQDLKFKLVNMAHLVISIQDLTQQLLLDQDCLFGASAAFDSKCDIFYDPSYSNSKVDKTMKCLEKCFIFIILEYCKVSARKEDFQSLFKKVKVDDFSLNENKKKIHDLTKILSEKVKFDLRKKQKVCVGEKLEDLQFTSYSESCLSDEGDCN